MKFSVLVILILFTSHLNNHRTESILGHAFTNRFEAHGRTQLKHMAGRKAVHDGDDDDDGDNGH